MNFFIRLQNKLLAAFRQGRNRLVQRKRILTPLTLILVSIFLTSNVMAERFGVSRRGSSSNLFSFSQASAKKTTVSGQPANFSQSIQENSLPTSVSATPAEVGPKTASKATTPSSIVPQIKIPQTSEMAQPLPNIVRLVAFDNKGQSFGSGSYIGNYDDYGLILSNWHVVCESDGLVHVHFPNGFSSFGAIVNSDKTWDLAMIIISKPPQTVPSLPIARTVPKPGDALWIAGHGSGSYRLAGGTCIRYLAPEIPKNGTPPLYEIIELSVTARQGDSGGPILNQDGELAGVLFGSDMVRNTAGSYCQRVSRFLGQTRSELDRLPKRPEEFFVSVEPNGPKRQLADSLNVVPTKQMYAETMKKNVDVGGTGGFGIRSPSRRYIQPSHPASVVVSETPQGIPNTTKNTGTNSATTSKETLEPPKTGQNRQEKTTVSQSVQSAVWNEPLAQSKTSRQNRSKTSIVQTKHNGEFDFRIKNKTKVDSVLSIPGPFANDLSDLNPNGHSSNTISDLPQLSAIPQVAATNESYGRPAKCSQGEKQNEGKYISSQNATHPIIWGSILIAFLASILTFVSIKLLRTDRPQTTSEPGTILTAAFFRHNGRQDNESKKYKEAAA